jgi:hypothetical protein
VHTGLGHFSPLVLKEEYFKTIKAIRRNKDHLYTTKE